MGKKKRSMERRVFNIVGYFFATFLSLACLLPFILVVSGSLSDNALVLQNG